MQIKGNKGGSSSGYTPTESPDSLQSIAYAKMLLALGEGEFAGGLDGTKIFLSGTPLNNPDGSENFTGVKWDFRPGNQAQDYIQGMPDVENEITVNTELKSTTPWTRAINNTQLSAVRIRFGWPQLQQQADNGDVNGYRIEYAIDLATDGGAFQQVLSTAVDGKTTTLYERTHRIDLPKATTGWQIRVRRLTPNSTSNRIADKMNIEAIAEVIDAKLRYPNTALLYIEFDAKQFSDIPPIACEPQGTVIRIPTTYDPVSRAYSGTWDGTFKWAYSNNPAWIFYHLVLSERFGLGDRINANMVDKWELYRIAQYCDQLVPDGRGGSGTEPRFTCDVYIQSQAEAFTVLRDLAAVFRGMTYWANNQLCALADMPRDMDYTYTRASVVDGKFTYSGGSQKNRYSTAMVSWSDPSMAYQDAIEAVMDNDLVRRYGVNELDITAIGCIRQTEANRRGRWALLTNSKDRSVSFAVGLDGMIPLPGNIIGVADQMLAGRIIGGRISSVGGRNITLDRVADVKVGDRLLVNLPSGKSQARTVQAVNGKVVTVSTAYTETPVTEAVWSVDANDLAIQQYRVTGITDNGDNTFAITAVQYDPDKYARVDTGARIDERPISVIPPGIQAPPTGVTIDSYSSVNQGIAITTLRAAWNAVDNAIAYEAEWKKDNGNWINVARTSVLGFEVPNIYAGRYLVRVRAINASNISSVWATSQETQLNGKEGSPPVPVGFATTPQLWGIGTDWGFPDGAEDTLKTEIQYSATATGGNSQLLTDVPYPQRSYTMTGLKAGQEFWFRARLQDKTGNEGDWTGWVHGQTNTDSSDYLDNISDGIMTSDQGKQLTDQIDTNTDAIAENALANDADVQRWRKTSGQAKAEILEVRQTQVSDQQAFAQYQQVVQAQFDANTAEIETKATTVFNNDGTGSAIYTVKAGVTYSGTYYSAGMSIGVEVDGINPVKSRVLFSADQFAVLNVYNGVTTSPFAIDGGQVFINSELVKDASITNEKIGNYIQSANWVKGSSGWSIDKNGECEFNDAIVRGTIHATDGDFGGTVYASKIVGPVTSSKPFGEWDWSQTSSGGTFEVSRHFYFVGGYPYGMTISLLSTPTELTGGANSWIEVEVWIGGVLSGASGRVYRPDGTPSGISVVCVTSGSRTLPAYAGRTEVEIKYRVHVVTGVTLKSMPSAIIATQDKYSAFE